MDKFIDFYVGNFLIIIGNFCIKIGIAPYLSILLQYICKVLLVVTEWKLLSAEIKHILQNTDKAIIIYPHTTYWDFMFMLLYIGAEPIVGKDLVRLVNQKLFDRFPNLLTFLGCEPITSKEVSKGGFIENTIAKLKNKEKFKLLISPEGALRKCEWRSGYYWLSKGLQCPIIVLGLDYSSHCVKYGGTFEVTEELPKVQIKCQEVFKPIIPLYPECSYVKINQPLHPPSITGLLTLSAVLCPLPTLYFLYYISPITCLVGTICNIISIIYHHFEEGFLKEMEPFIVKFGFIFYVLTLIYKDLIVINFISVFLWGNVLICYRLGSGRNIVAHRSCDYNKYHLMFHIFSGFATSYMLI